MTLEEKIQNLQRVSMKEARSEGNALIKGHADFLSHRLSEHQQKMKMQAENRIGNEKARIRLRQNRDISEYQIRLRRELNEYQEELKKKLFGRVRELLKIYMKTGEYLALLSRQVREAMLYADGEETVIYINASDRELKEAIEERTGALLTVSSEDFTGGIRAVIRTKNILIDRSFSRALEKEYADFLFRGGEKNV